MTSQRYNTWYNQKRHRILSKSLDPSSDEKSHLYRQVVEQLDYLESEGYRPEDIDTRRRVLEKHYNKGFNIIYETSLNNFDDELNGTKAQVILIQW